MIHEYSLFAIRFTENLGIHWYGLFYFLAVFFAFGLTMWFSSRQQAGFTKEMAIDFIGFAGVGLLVGARAGYLLYEPGLIMQFRNDFPYWGLFAIDDGGLSIHGAMLGLLLSTLLFSFKSGISHLYLLDLSSVIGSFSIILGRLANFFSGEYLGRTVTEASGFGTSVVNRLMENHLIRFPQEILRWPFSNFSKLESLVPVIEKIPELNKETWLSSLQQYQESESARALAQNYLETILKAVQNGSMGVADVLSPLLELRHPVQIYGAALEGLFIFLFLVLVWFNPRKPGVITAWFVTLYSLVRLFEEQFALPDAQLGFRWLGVTQAQGLSILSLLFGLWLLFFYGRGSALAFPGWGLGQNVKIHRRN